MEINKKILKNPIDKGFFFVIYLYQEVKTNTNFIGGVIILIVKVFNNVPEELLELKIRDWLYETRKELGEYLKDIEIVSTSQSQDREYVTLTIFYKQVNLK